MKNLLKYNTVLGLSVLLGFTSCMDDDRSYPEANKPLATIVASNTTITEGESASLTITTNRAIDTPTDFKIELVSGTATLEDFSVGAPTIDEYELGPAGFQATLPATQSTLTVDIEAVVDILPEGTETAKFRVVQGQEGSAIVQGGEYVFELNIQNLETTDFTFKMDWDTTYTGVDDESHHACDFDLDLEIYTASFGGPLAVSYSSCPEEIHLSAGDLADGDYWLIPSFWDVTSGVAPASDFQIPAVVTFAKDGVWLETVDLTDQWNTADGGAVQGNPDSYLVKYILTIAGTTYTVTDADSGQIVGTGRMSAPKNTPTNFVGGRQQ